MPDVMHDLIFNQVSEAKLNYYKKVKHNENDGSDSVNLSKLLVVYISFRFQVESYRFLLHECAMLAHNNVFSLLAIENDLSPVALRQQD